MDALQTRYIARLRDQRRREVIWKQTGEFIGGFICLALLYGLAWMLLEVAAR